MKNAWMDQAACLGEDLNLFFPDTPNNHAKAAKAICKTCNVVAECLQFALENNEQGVWGGLTDNQRRNLRSQLGMQKPRSVPECGTTAGYAAHTRNGTKTCLLCKAANSAARAKHRENARLKAL